jgi:hypothetical protein
MSGEISLVFHVGFGKTASTTIQSYLAKLSDIFFIGKDDTNKERSSIFKGELYDLHYTLFKSYRMEVIMGFANPSRSSATLLTEYADKIVQLAVASKKELVVLSDECIGDYYNYIGEWNVFLIIALGNMVEEKLRAKGYKVKKNLSFTIRRQLDVIKSVIGYSQTLNIRSVDQFLDCFSTNPYEGIMASYYYYSNTRLIENIADMNWSIQVVPYEILAIDHRLDTYISRILNQKTIKVETDYGKERMNVNSSVNPNTGKLEQILRPRNYFKATGFRFICEGRNIYSKALKRRMLATKCWGAGLYVIGHIYSALGALQNKFLKWLGGNKDDYVFCSEDAKKQIQETYLADNERLVRYVDENELKKFGYIG